MMDGWMDGCIYGWISKSLRPSIFVGLGVRWALLWALKQLGLPLWNFGAHFPVVVVEVVRITHLLRVLWGYRIVGLSTLSSKVMHWIGDASCCQCFLSKFRISSLWYIVVVICSELWGNLEAGFTSIRPKTLV